MRFAGVVLAICALASCKKVDPLYCPNNLQDPRCSGDGGVTGDAGTVNIGGMVSGLGTASGLVLQNNGGDDKPVISDGSFRFPTPVAVGSAYDVTVSVQPTNPSETCTVTNGSGTADGDVTDVEVTCAPASYMIGGTVVGLPSGTAMLSDNGSFDTLTVPNGPFQFAKPVQSGAMFAVTTSTAGCSVGGGTGTVGNANVTTVVVNCNPNAFTIGGHVMNLNGTAMLQNNGGDTISVSSNGTYAFPTPIAAGGSWNITVVQQPTYPPASQACAVNPSSGNSLAGPITGADMTCTTHSFTVGGAITGVTGTVVLQNNLADDLSRTTDGGFTFATAIQSGTPYAVSVSQTPQTLQCALARATGTVGNGNVSNVAVACGYRDPGIYCGGAICTPPMVCCDPEGAPHCTAAGACASLAMPCDSRAECGGASNFCCAELSTNGMSVTAVDCQPTASCAGGKHDHLCDPMAAGTCGPMKSCLADSVLPGYYSCQ